MNEIKITIDFKSDWHIGSGAGIPKFIDRLVLKDENELPYIPAKTLTGMLRDAAETIVEQLDAGQSGDFWKKTLVQLFGGQPESHGGDSGCEATGACLSVRHGRFPQGMQDIFATDTGKPLRDGLFFLQPGVRIEYGTGRAKDKHLFFTEMVRADSMLEADVAFPATMTKAQVALLVASVAGVRKIGGGRRRGGGKCRLAIEGLPGVVPESTKSSSESWLNWLEQNVHSPEGILNECCYTKPEPIDAPKSIDPAKIEPNSLWFTLPLSLKTITPIVVHKQTIGNVVQTLDYIPGTLLLPGILKRIKSLMKNSSVLPAALGAGNIVITPFAPTVAKAPSLPVPNTFFYPKDSEENDTAINALCGTIPKKQHKGHREGRICLDATGNLIFDIGKESTGQSMHNTVSDQAQRPDEDVGGVYTYEYLKSGLELRGELRIKRSFMKASMVTPEVWEDLINGTIRVGRSAKDDYGQCELSVADAPLHDDFTPDKSWTKRKLLVVWLMSDVLLRDDLLNLSAAPEDLRKALEKELKIALPFAQGKDTQGSIPSIGRVERIESWQKRWNLPRPSLVGLKAGSVFTFKVKIENQDEYEKALFALQEKGIGERRAEGYGRILFNPSLLLSPSYNVKKPEKPTAAPSTSALTEPLQAFVRSLEIHSWKEKIKTQAREHAFVQGSYFGIENKRWWKGDNPNPSTSQWGSLRSASVACSNRKDLRPLEQWITGVNKTENRRKKWEGKLGVLDDLIHKDQKVWEIINVPIRSCLPDDPFGKELKARLRNFAICALIESVCEAIFDKAQKQGGRL